MNVVFMGTPEFACEPLRHLCASDKHHVIAVVTGSDSRCGRGGKMRPTAVCAKAADMDLHVIRTQSPREEHVYHELKQLAPDLIVVVAYKILPPRIYKLPRFGALNIHASLLPKYRGAAPINWALINGEKETGLTSFLLKKKVDTGDIILQRRYPIFDDDNFDSLYDRLSEESGPFLLETIDRLESGTFRPAPQDDSLATPAPRITAEDAMIDFGFPAENVRNFIRGLSTVPGAYTWFRGDKVKVLACTVVDASPESGTRPGSVLTDRKRLIIACAKSAIEVTSIVPEGKRAMDGASFLNGFRPEPGEVFGERAATAERKH
jgi:methionyl-tRNA formyltransferase